MYIYIHIHIHTHIQIHIHVKIQIHINITHRVRRWMQQATASGVQHPPDLTDVQPPPVCVYACEYIHMLMNIYVCICVYIYTYIYYNMYMYARVYMYINIYIHTQHLPDLTNIRPRPDYVQMGRCTYVCIHIQFYTHVY